MPTRQPFLRFMLWLFKVLQTGALALLLLLFVVMPAALTWQSIAPAQSTGYSSIRYDTTLRNSLINVSSSSIGSLDNWGNYVARVERRDDYLTYFDEANQPLVRLSLDSLSRVAPQLHRLRQRYLRQIDSARLVNPSALFTLYPDRWTMLPTSGTGFAITPTLPVFAGFLSPPSGRPFRVRTPQLLVSSQPYAELTPRVGNATEHWLQISIHRWTDITPDLWPILTLTLFSGLSYLLILWLIIRWFRQIFSDLWQGVYFTDTITRRVRYIGGVFVAGFLIRNAYDIVGPMLARQYLQIQGFVVVGWQYTGPGHWLWLFVGLTTLTLAQVFHYGSQLQREQDLTV